LNFFFPSKYYKRVFLFSFKKEFLKTFGAKISAFPKNNLICVETSMVLQYIGVNLPPLYHWDTIAPYWNVLFNKGQLIATHVYY
jgi:hypothetical protein